MLKKNKIAPDFRLPMIGNGESHYYGTGDKQAVLIFYKYTCPTCQFALPYLQKIYDAYGDQFYFVAIAQDGPEPTKDFRKEYKITIPTLMDVSPYPVSREYQLEIVPTILTVSADHKILNAGEGFAKQELLNLADELAEKTGRPQIELYGDAQVPDFKPG
jgi:peroxiredoxin